MTNSQKKQYLSQYIELKREVELLEDCRGRLYTIPAQKLSNMPSCPRKIGDSLAEEICHVIDLEENYIRIEIETLANIKMDIFHRIRAMDNSIQRQIMYYRYIYGFKWEEICIKMNYSWSQIHELHGKALKNIDIKQESCNVAV